MPKTAFETLGTFLANTRKLWSPRPFCADPAWALEHDPLVAWLLARSDAEVEAWEPDLSAARGALHPELAALEHEAARLAHLETLSEVSKIPSGDSAHGVSARKWTQLRAFVPRVAPSPFVDWCAGKGHLGRTVARLWSADGIALEIDPQLATRGAELARREGADLSFRIGDVLDDTLDASIVRGRTVLALHACGDLGDRALTFAVRAAASGFAWAPCCFHRGRDRFVPWSLEGRSSGLEALTNDELRLPTTDETLTSPRVRRRRRTAMAYRLGLDHLRAEATGDRAYEPFPSVPDPWLADGFENFCRLVSRAHGVALPSKVAWDDAERIGRERMARVRRLGLVRAAFRRPLEVWLDLDRASWLGEQGFHVEVGTFCDRPTTPRNVLVRTVSPR